MRLPSVLSYLFYSFYHMIVLWALALAPDHASKGQSENEKDQKKNKNNSK
jgi:hypothetical protein